MEKYTKEDLRRAFEAGKLAAKFNNDLAELLERGTKQAPAERTFDNWFENTLEEKQSGFSPEAMENKIRTFTGWQEPNGQIG